MDGTCAIDAILTHDFEKDASSSLELYVAAEALFEKCIIGTSPPLDGQMR